MPTPVPLVYLELTLLVLSPGLAVFAQRVPSPAQVLLHVHLALLDGSPRVQGVLSVLCVPKDTTRVEDLMLVLHVLVENTKRVMLRMVVMIAWVVISLLVLLLLHVLHVQQVKCLLMELTPARIVPPVNMLLPLPMLAVHVLKVNTLPQLLLLVLHVQLVSTKLLLQVLSVPLVPLVT